MRRFNPRTHVGCDIMCIAISIHLRLFQSTHPRRVRLNWFSLIGVSLRFQSTHPRRVRLQTFFVPYSSLWFQSTHPRRVRRAHNHGCLWTDSFQSTHPRRVRLIGFPCNRLSGSSFNPRTHVGCDVIFHKFDRT